MNEQKHQNPLLSWWDDRIKNREKLDNSEVKLGHYRISLRHMGVEIEHRNRIIRALTSFIIEANKIAEPLGLLKLALARALGTTSSDVGAIILFDRDSEELTVGAQLGMTEELLGILTGHQLDEGASLLMPHVVTGEGALLELSEQCEEGERRLLDAGRLKSLASLPLQGSGRLLGALVVGNRNRASFLPANLYALLALAQEAAVAWESLHLRESLWQMAETLLAKETSATDADDTGKESITSQPSNAPASLQLGLAHLTAAIGGTMGAILTLAAGDIVPDVKLVASYGLSKRFTRQFARSRYSDGLFPFAKLARRNLVVRELTVVNATHAIPLLVGLEEEGAQSLLAMHLSASVSDPTEAVIIVAALTPDAFLAYHANQLLKRARDLQPLIIAAHEHLREQEGSHTLSYPVEATEDELEMLLEAMEKVEENGSSTLIPKELVKEINGLMIDK